LLPTENSAATGVSLCLSLSSKHLPQEMIKKEKTEQDPDEKNDEEKSESQEIENSI
jgi:hypothetical protein